MERLVITAIVVAVIAAIGAGIYYDAKGEREWREFAAVHECTVVGKVASSTSVGVGIGTNGSTSIVPITTPGKTGYACNDGVTYWR